MPALRSWDSVTRRDGPPSRGVLSVGPVTVGPGTVTVLVCVTVSVLVGRVLGTLPFKIPKMSVSSSVPATFAACGPEAHSAYDNAMVASFWGRTQVELFNRKPWTTRIELATAIHDYIELFHNTRRRHSALGMLSPT
ncbi:MAG: IS3 family transposase, partial [Geodermatophilaceae bacterium]